MSTRAAAARLVTPRRRLLAGAAGLLAGFAVLALFVARAGQTTDPLDQWVADHLFHLGQDYPPTEFAAVWVGHLFEPWCLRGVALLWGLWLWRHSRARAGAWLVATMVAGGALAILAKLVYTRARPVWPDPITLAAGYSFPSGHATSAALLAGCVLVLLRPGLTPGARRRLTAASVGAALLVGLDRLLLGVHFLTDVLGGYLLGSAVVMAMLAAWPVPRARRPDRPAAAPS